MVVLTILDDLNIILARVYVNLYALPKIQTLLVNDYLEIDFSFGSQSMGFVTLICKVGT